ncbi:MAG: signal peptidase I [Terrimicrobiaceae bacterium]|nr:signal peptidase I [Terrimicrobiaceae bacterium]
MFPFRPRYLKEAKNYLHGARKFLNYKRDILKPDQIAKIEERVAGLKAAMREKRCEPVLDAMKEIDALIGKISPPPKDAAWRENVEVFLVAIVVAAGIKAFLVQPFRIPTGSMQPTLFGIVGTPTESSPPNIIQRAFEFVALGRHYIDLRAAEDDVVVRLQERTYANFFTFTDIVCRKRTYTLFVPAKPLEAGFRVIPGREYRRGDVIARGHMDTGDQVLVDKMSYNFVKPKDGDVFVFKTTDITRIEETIDPRFGSQHYIKRLAGTPGQTLRISPPSLFVNGQVPEQFVFQRVMSMKDGYRGYSNRPAGGPPFPILGGPEKSFTVPPKSYFALGDNSYHSSDSRYFGPVPERNVAGRGFFVYWPFTSRWGLIR